MKIYVFESYHRVGVYHDNAFTFDPLGITDTTAHAMPQFQVILMASNDNYAWITLAAKCRTDVSRVKNDYYLFGRGDLTSLEVHQR